MKNRNLTVQKISFLIQGQMVHQDIWLKKLFTFFKTIIPIYFILILLLLYLIRIDIFFI